MRLTRSGLMIPTRMNEQPKYRCNIPDCDAVFYDGEERARVAHMLEHANSDDEVIAQQTRDTNLEILGPGDVEKQEWQAQRLRQLVKDVGPKEALKPERY